MKNIQKPKRIQGLPFFSGLIMRIFILFITMAITLTAQEKQKIRLLVRADDIGSFHAANEACIHSCRNGIARSVELMVPCAWFPEAVKMLRENPSVDVGVHLTLTSEWEGVKWRPLTQCPGLTDENGYFFPSVWKREGYPPGTSIQESAWTMEELEKELRAQIKLAINHLPDISHLTTHMGFDGLNPDISRLIERLAREFQLQTNLSSVKRFRGWDKNMPLENRIDQFCENLGNLTPGDHLFVEHPSANTPEMQGVGHPGYENVAHDREWVTKVFTSDKVKQTIKEKGIVLVSYQDFRY